MFLPLIQEQKQILMKKNKILHNSWASLDSGDFGDCYLEEAFLAPVAQVIEEADDIMTVKSTRVLQILGLFLNWIHLCGSVGKASVD